MSRERTNVILREVAGSMPGLDATRSMTVGDRRSRARDARLGRRLLSAALVAGLIGYFGTTSVAPAHAEALIRTIGCGTNAELLNTGYNGATGALSPGDVDLAWMASGPFKGSNGTGLPTTWSPDRVAEITADPTTVGGGFLLSGTTRGWTQSFVTSNSMVVPTGFSAASAVISQDHDGYALQSTQDDYAYMIQFNLAPEVAAPGVSMHLTLLADNSVAAVYVNGIAQTGTNLPQSGSLDGATPYGYAGYSTGNASIVAATAFKPGLNTLLVQVKTSGGAGDKQFLKVSSQGLVMCNPVVIDDEASTTVNTAKKVFVMANDGNLPDGAKVSQVVGDDSGAGTWALNASDNSVTFTPTHGFLGTATATYTVTASDDTVLGSAQVSVAVNPVLTPDQATIPPATPVQIEVLANDTVWPSATVSVRADQPGQGEWTVDANVVHFFPAPGFAGTATATYTVTGPDGETAHSTVSVDVLGLSVEVTSPTAVPDAAGQTVTYAVTLTNNSAVGLVGGGVHVDEFTGRGAEPQVACAAADGSARDNGFLELDAGESVACTVTYTVTQADLDAGDDLAVDLTALAHAGPEGGPHVTVTASESADGVAVAQHPALEVELSADPIQAVEVDGPTVFAVTVTNTGNVTLTGVGVDPGQVSGTGGAPVVGSCVYAQAAGADPASPPAPGENGSLQLAPGASATCQVTYTATRADVDSGAVSLTMGGSGTDPGGDPVVAPRSDPVRVALVELAVRSEDTPWNTPASIDVLGGIANLPAGSSVSGVDASDASQAGWWAVDSGTGAVSFTPPPTFSGTARAGVTITFPDGSTSVQQLAVTVVVPNVTVADTSGAVKAGATTELSPAITAPDGSELRVDGDDTQGTWTVNSDRTITFVPADGFLGTATATLTVTAPDGTSDTAQLSAEVTLTPAADDASDTVPKGQSVTLRPQLVVPDGSVVSVVGTDAQGTWTKNDDNSVTFVPADDFVGTARATLQITGPDGLTATARLTVVVTPIPAVDDATQTGRQGEPVVLRPAVSVPAGSTVEVVGDPSQGTWVVNDDHSVTFTPRDGFIGTANATMTVTAPNGAIATADLAATVTAVPSVADASGTVPQGQSVTLRPQLFAPDGSVVEVLGVPSQGTWVVNNDHSVTFTPADGFVGTATARVQITGPDGLTDTGRLTVEVTMVPTAQGALGSVRPGASVTLTPHIVAPDGSTVEVVGDPAQGVWTVNENSSVTFVPASGFTGRATAVLTVTAPNGTTATADLVVNVAAGSSGTGDDTTPAVGGASGSGPQGQPVVLRPSMTLPDGSTVSVVGDPAQGTWTFDPDTGEVVFTPADGFTGQATATITVTAPDGTTASAQLSTTVVANTDGEDPGDEPGGGTGGTGTTGGNTGTTGGNTGTTGSPVGTGGTALGADLGAALVALLLLAGAMIAGGAWSVRNGQPRPQFASGPASRPGARGNT